MFAPRDKLRIQVSWRIQIYIRNGFRLWVRGSGDGFNGKIADKELVALPLYGILEMRCAEWTVASKPSQASDVCYGMWTTSLQIPILLIFPGIQNLKIF